MKSLDDALTYGVGVSKMAKGDTPGCITNPFLQERRFIDAYNKQQKTIRHTLERRIVEENKKVTIEALRFAQKRERSICPNCGSSETQETEDDLYNMRCNDCGFEFEDEDVL